MENLTLETVLLAVLGMVIHLLMKIRGRSNKGQEKVSIKDFCSDTMNWIRISLTLLSTFALLLMAKDVIKLMGFNFADKSMAMLVYSFTAGYLNHSLIRNVLKAFKKRTGIN